eukprot:TRINITY_DN88039_c0_g1_i1.p1 TRINITY_DN88039_c0_g1~~TRINITY_DN88039_c0_g1_i1.p1  ORF type:complete len:330 (-),score=72.63 TRINITY_DN88039_c0_g1_i1:97-1086(-)
MPERTKGKSKGASQAAGKAPATKSNGGYNRPGRRGRGNRRNDVACESPGYHDAAEEWLTGAEESWSGAAAPWPPQDPAWWAALASHLPAAWGTGKGGFPALTAVRMDGLDSALHQSPAAEGAAPASDDGQGNEREAEAATDSVLDALAPAPPGRKEGSASSSPSRPRAAIGGKHWVVAEGRLPDELGERYMAAENILGSWVDSQGSMVRVLSTDAYNIRLLATMSRLGRPDMFLAVKPIRMGAGWQCGHYILDETWSTTSQLHWVAGDGRVSVWVRPQAQAASTASTDAAGDDSADAAVDDSTKDAGDAKLSNDEEAKAKKSENDRKNS